MVAKTLDIGSPVITTDRTEARSDMFAQSNALYSRINKKSKTSPWMIIAPVAVVVLVGGALVATSGMHSTPVVKSTIAPPPAASAPVASAPATISKSVKSSSTTTVAKSEPAKPVLKVQSAPQPARQPVATTHSTARVLSQSGPAPSAYDRPQGAPATTAPAPVQAAPAPTVTTQPDTVTPAPAAAQAAPSTPAPAATPAPASDPAPATPPM